MSVSPSFRTTQWSVVAAAGGEQAGCSRTEPQRTALDQLLQAYWYPVYAYARRKGHGLEDARDLVQSFFTDLLESGDLSQADAQRGRFRTFLLTCFVNFSTNQWHHDRALKRGGDRKAFSLDQTEAEQRYGLEPVTELDAERIYMSSWAHALMENVLMRLGSEYSEKGKAEVFERLKPMLSGALAIGSYAKIAEELGVSEGAVKVASHRLRKRFGELLRGEISQTVLDPEEIEDEIRGLFEALGE